MQPVNNKKRVFSLFFFSFLFQLHSAEARYDYAGILKENCQTLSGSDAVKGACYQRHNTPGSAQIDVNAPLSQEMQAIQTFLGYYQNSLYGDFRSIVWAGKPKASGAGLEFGDAQSYYRTVCNTVAAAAIFGKVNGIQTNSGYYDRYTDLLMSVFDDYYNAVGVAHNNPSFAGGWGANIQWSSGFIGYPCGMASSLMWPHIRTYSSAWDQVVVRRNRSADEKKLLIRSELLDFAEKIRTQHSLSFYYNMQAAEGPKGNSQAEEIAEDTSFLALMGWILPNAKQDIYRSYASDLLNFAYKACNSLSNCPLYSIYGTTLTDVNHGFGDNPHYGLSLLIGSARAALPFYKFGPFGINMRNNIPGQIYGMGQDAYRFVDMFESQLTHVWMDGDFRYIGTYSYFYPHDTMPYLYNNRVYVASPYINRGVTDWGMGVRIHNSAFALSYVLDPSNWNHYRDNNSPLALLINFQRAVLTPSSADNHTLYLPPYFDGKQWTYQPLDKMRGKVMTGLVQMATVSNDYNSPITTDVESLMNTHFMLNSIGVMEHIVSYLLLSNQNYLSTLN